MPGAELIIVDDGSTDDTGAIAAESADVCIRHPQALGNGAAIKAGARAAGREALVTLDGDGQHDPDDIPRLLHGLERGYAMSVGARSADSHAGVMRRLANTIYNKLAGYIVGHAVLDLTSGFRAVSRKRFTRFIDILPNGFSYPTTITLAFFRAGYPVCYTPIVAGRRAGKSHIRPLYDGARFLLILFRVGSLYSPLKLFAPAAAALFAVASCYYAYTYIAQGRFTNMSALLYIGSMLTFFIGLVSEQITQLLYTALRDGHAEDVDGCDKKGMKK